MSARGLATCWTEVSTQHYSIGSDFLQRHRTAAISFGGIVTGGKAFPTREGLPLLMVLTAGRNKAGSAQQTKGEDQITLPLCICSGVLSGSIKPDPMPVEINEKIATDSGRDHPEAEEQLAQHCMSSLFFISLWYPEPHTCHTQRGSSGLARPWTLFVWLREMGLTRTGPGDWEAGGKSILFFLDDESVVTKPRLPEDAQTWWLLLVLYFIFWTLKEVIQWQGGWLPEGVPLPGAPLSLILRVFPFAWRGFTSGLPSVWKHWIALNDSSTNKTL